MHCKDRQRCCLLKYNSQTTLGMLQSSIRHIFPFKHVLKGKKNPKLQEMEVQQGHNNKDVPGGQSYSKPAESMRSNKQPEGLGHSWPTSCLRAAAVTLPSVPGEPHHLLLLSLLPLALSSLLSYSSSLIFQLSLPVIHFITRVACLTALRTQSPGIRALQL